MVQDSRLGKVAEDVDQLDAGGLALPEAVLLGAADGVLAEAGEAGDGAVGRMEVAVEVGLQVPHELGLDGEEGADHEREEKPALGIRKI